MRSRRWMAWSLLLLGCYNPNIVDEQYICSTNADCPTGFKCSDCLTCIAEDEPSSQCTSPCTNGNKQRAAGDPGNPAVAFCPAAWLSFGSEFSTPPQCDRQPDADGSGCAPVDNCAPGWRVCRESDLVAHGFTQAACNSAGISGFFVADQPGGRVDGNPTCGAAGDAFFGCGSEGVQSAGCSILSRSSYAVPASSACSGLSPGWVCSLSGQGTIVLRRATGDQSSPAASLAGGIMCCR